MLQAIDNYLIVTVNKWAVYIEQKTGKNNVYIAKALTVIAFMLATPIGLLVYSHNSLNEELKFTLALITGIIALLTTSNVIIFLSIKKRSREDDGSGLATIAALNKHLLVFFRWLQYFLLLKLLIVGYSLPWLISSALCLQLTLIIIGNLLVTPLGSSLSDTSS